ncbi:MAG: 50S ribosomal protein L32 [Elusimicrobiota bacterium]|jgi:large subunit ribosomal protein L32|nr:50S ribosomal protein L32 [Elusimicrobiota bacterium]
MANPKRRHSRSRRDKRRANWKLKEKAFLNCTQCGSLVISHRACNKCGFYNGEIAMIIKSKDKKVSTSSSVQEV